ncbi:hypothetical protein SAMN05446037_100670 [Anaerovirgula multivorans]|uniref:Uncharacterized protein n=1 Tax=Anaerovirgula multivorans TaxID=312168 RepID=A0A239CNM2_9FIRM|nr:hypothetical protein [Anaerovirgula multivorans]SNS21737.1 hypothetical protein SAMN05446037_100670 [Anaerovirgula multivorans]
MAHFKWVEKYDVKAKRFLNFLKEEVVDNLTAYPFNADAGETAENNVWTVQSSETDTDGNITSIIFKRGVADGQVGKVFYVKFFNETLASDSTYATFSVQVLENYNEGTSTFGNAGPVAKYQCANESIANTERSKESALHVFLNITNKRLAMVIVADPVVNFNDYRKSFMYAGEIVTFEGNVDDIDGNVLLTAGCVNVEPTMAQLQSKTPSEYFGVYTSPGNNTFQMLGTKSGVRFQKHYPAFITQAPKPGNAFVDSVLGDTGLELEAQGYQASRWTDKYHLSPIYVAHPYEGYRGHLFDCISVIRHNILHMDKLIIDVDVCKYPDKKWKQEVFRYFDINTEQNFYKLSPNQGTAVALLAEVRY